MELLERVQSLRGAVLLCGYPSQLYDDALRGWQRNQRTARTDGGQRIEVVWTNRAAGVSALKESNGDVA
jgi:DNA adenine methylase